MAQYGAPYRCVAPSPSGMRTISRPLRPPSTRIAASATMCGRKRPASPISTRIRVAFGDNWIPAPVSSSRSACSRISARKPLRARASAAVSPPIPAPAMMTVREDGRAIANRSDWFAFQRAFRRPRFIGLERPIVAVKRRTIRANIFVVVAHVAKDVRMIERRHGADAHEFLGADLYFGNTNIIMEKRNDTLGHALDCLLVIAPAP